MAAVTRARGRIRLLAPLSDGPVGDRLGDRVSFVLVAHGSAELVTACLARVLEVAAASDEVLLVDNGPAWGVRRERLRDAADADVEGRVRIVREPQPRLSAARNRGLAEATHPITAFVNEDIHLDRTWRSAILRGFDRSDGVVAVFGSSPPAALDSPGQVAFEHAFGWGAPGTLEPRLIELRDPSSSRMHPFLLRMYPSGGHLAFDTAFLRRIGGLDPDLGPGARTRAGDDIDVALRAIYAGGTVAVEPAAIGWNVEDWQAADFERRMFAYGVGLTATLTKLALRWDTGHDMIRRVVGGIPALFRARRVLPDRAGAPPPLPLRLELAYQAGKIWGPFAYAAECRHRRRSRP